MSERTNNHEFNNNNKEASSWRTNVAFGIIGTSFVGTVALISPFITMQLKSNLPYMATPRNKVVRALEYIAKRKNNDIALSQNNIPRKHTIDGKTFRYYDLGSGDGETVIAAGSLGWKATGIELNSTLWGISSLRRLKSPSHVRRNSNFIWGDMWANSIHDADAVMIFGVKPLMPQIAKKISDECKPGTFVMSYRFFIPCKPIGYEQCDNYELEEGTKSRMSDIDGDEELGKLDARLVYDKDEMRIYELSSKSET